MTVFDYIVLAILGLSVLVSVMRGLVREVLALASWVAAFFVARRYALELVPLLPPEIPTDALRYMVGFLIVLLATLLVCALLRIAINQIVKSVGLGSVDRVLGGIFGLMRGMLIVTILVMLAGFTSIPKDARWRDAMFSAPLEAMVIYFLPFLPEDIAKHIKYD